MWRRAVLAVCLVLSVRAVRAAEVSVAAVADATDRTVVVLGLAWLSGRKPALLAAVSNAVLYGGALSPAERSAVPAGPTTIR